jgi:hypothetical protein
MRISFLEALLVFIALLWILGVFKKTASAGRPSSFPPSPPPAPKTPSTQQANPAKKPMYGSNEGDYVDYEEIS